MLMILQSTAARATPKIAQATVLGILVASTLIVIGLLGLIGILAWKTERSLEYGDFFVVVLGILTALIGFLVGFPLLVSGVFDDAAQVLSLLSAFFGTIVALVDTFFGIKASSDARQDVQMLARDTLAVTPRGRKYPRLTHGIAPRTFLPILVLPPPSPRRWTTLP